MKKTLLAIAVFAGLFAASCQEESGLGVDSSEQGLLQFTASVENGVGSRTTVARVDGETPIYKTSWENTDCIRIEGATYQATPGSDATNATFTKTSGTDPAGPTFKAYYPATMFDGTTATLPASYTYAEGKYNMPMYAESSTNSLAFKNLCGVLAITVPSTQIASVNSITVLSDKRMNGAFTATAAGALTFTSTAELTDADKKVTLMFSETKAIGSGSSVTFYVPIPAGTHNPLTISVSNGTITKTMVTTKSGGVTIARNTVYPITFAYKKQDMLPGVFSVSATKKVRFSKGNLQATCPTAGAEGTSQYSWGFAENQYDYVGNSSGNTTIANQTLGAKVDLFGWVGNSGTLAGNATKYGIAVSSNSTRSTDFGNVLGEKLKADWGTTIDNNGTWRSLTMDEVAYLFSFKGKEGEGKPDCTNPTRQGLNAYNVTVAGHKNCIVLYPDGFTGTKVSNGDETSYDTLEEWAAAEAQGVVCLPAAGIRVFSNVKNVGTNSFYWTNQSVPSQDQNKTSAFPFGVGYEIFNASQRVVSGSVRLVTEVK